MTTTEQGLAAERLLFDALEALKQGKTEPWVEMFHDDGVMEFPYAPAGFPRRLDNKTAIADYMRTYPDHLSVERVVRRAVYHAGDVMVVEFTLDLTARATGIRVEMSYVGILTFADGKVRLYRDYWDPLVATKAMEVRA